MELTEADYEVYLEALGPFDAWKLEAALELCLRECGFMPKVHEIIERMPENPVPDNPRPDLKLIKEWKEPYRKGVNLHWYEFEGGYRMVRYEKIEAA